MLKKVTEYDGPLIVKWRNANREYFPPQPAFSTYSQNRWYWDQYLTDPADHYYMVLAGRMPVGTISFNSKTNEIGRVLLGEKEYACQGVMSEALKQLMGSFNMGRYWLRVLKGNGAAIAFYDRNGFFVTKDEGQMIRMER
jgi:RimJ/RimL family protein N-acetyltransferase